MALMPCPECRRRISETAESCPSCGYTLTLAEVTKIKEIRRKRSTWLIGSIVFLASLVVIAILAGLYSRKSTTMGNWQGQAKSSTGTSTNSSQSESSKFPEIQSPSAPVRSAPRPSELPETETRQEQIAGNEAWFGTWSLEFIGDQSTEENLAEDLQSDIFLSWNHTFHTNGRFESKLRQDTGEGILTTTTYGTYQISGNTYNTVLKEAIRSLGSASVRIPNITSYQSGTWSRVGDTLTMIPVDSATKVFKLLDTPETIPPDRVWGADYEHPRILKKVDPKYPEAARRVEQEGLVTIEFTVDVDGKAVDIKVVKPIGSGFDEAAIEAVKKWRFTPAKRGGEHVPMRVQVPIRFTLED